MPGGRPSAYSPELAEAVCERIVRGESVRAIGRDPAMPAASTLWLWLRRRPDFAAMYAWAKAVQMDLLAEEIIAIADGGGDVRHLRLRIDARKWLMARLAPKRYGRRTDHGVEGGAAQG
jgi:hypothetical protein